MSLPQSKRNCTRLASLVPSAAFTASCSWLSTTTVRVQRSCRASQAATSIQSELSVARRHISSLSAAGASASFLYASCTGLMSPPTTKN
jgi:hypothetical protein